MTSSTSISKRERILGGLWGSLVGDALGVPVEFKDRATVQADPVKDMRGYGSHHQPAGTWSDDGALMLCTVDSLLHSEFDTEDMGQRFVRWMNEEFWTATGVVFDIGGATADALMRIASGTPAEQAGGCDEFSNGNGSLMRILPVSLGIANEPLAVRRNRLERASAITHGHPRSMMACAFHGFVTRQLLLGGQLRAAIEAARTEFAGCYQHASEFSRFKHILNDNLVSLPEGEVVSTGYVLHTLHASLWCLLTTSSFEECVLKAVNLGGDTDTTGCVAGGLAGGYYGLEAIPQNWIQALAHREEVEVLFNRFADMMTSLK
ncbi:MAG TPA: ADP-ribosylglycohydrolase family protein [Verrucomicrobiota bacterium]|nr:ADP-ribosylglycohydrolase family protein [Verrucomicrobiota bacterium]